jgi:glucoamylase
LAQGRRDLVTGALYRAELPALTLIKVDLEYVAHHWRDPSYDLWEEVMGDHYYTRMTQLRALREGAALADTLGDGAAAVFYRAQAEAIAASLDDFWDRSKNRLRATRNRVRGIDYKHSELDAAVVLAALHAGHDGERGGVDDDRLLATLPALERAFTQEYPLNQATPQLPPAIGRYAEDRYYGGNPWILTTAAMAEHAFRLRIAKASHPIVLHDVNFAFWSGLAPQLHLTPGSIVQPGSPDHQALMAALMARGEAYLTRVRRHMPADGRLDEQWDRHSGYQTSARDLTWSHASMITALIWRDAALTK